MFDWWAVVTEAQATIVSGLLTVFAAIVGIILGGQLFGGRVNDLKGALEKSEEAIGKHEAQIDSKLSNLVEKVKEVENQMLSMVEGIGKLRGSVGDLQSATIDSDSGSEQVEARERLRSDWTAIRDSLEQMVADPAIDGRTRARYARMDRRQYKDLLEAFHEDYGTPNIIKYRRALALWQKYKNGRLTPSAQDLDEMSNIRGTVAK